MFQKGYVGVTVEITVGKRKQGVAACSVHDSCTTRGHIQTPNFNSGDRTVISQRQTA